LVITSPKRTRAGASGWHGFFPYYAGYPTTFAENVIASSGLQAGAVVLDPWNGSGTTTFAASKLGLDSLGADLNPAMAMVARARLMPLSEAGSIRPLSRDVVAKAEGWSDSIADADPLGRWFRPAGAAAIRALETAIRGLLLDVPTAGFNALDFGTVSGTAATLYVALFSVARDLARPRRSSNPTWFRMPRSADELIEVTSADVLLRFREKCDEMAEALELDRLGRLDLHQRQSHTLLTVRDTADGTPFLTRADLILTSPPYCTRIDYVATTRIELAVLAPMVILDAGDLSRAMMGSTRVAPQVDRPDNLGTTCNLFLDQIRAHPSKASGGYYYKSHVDYFSKLSRSLVTVAGSLKPGGCAVLVVQDSYYKDVHNDLPAITVEMAESHGLRLRRREDFRLGRTLAGVNPGSRRYRTESVANEAVLCFEV
jgi:hypothetical protein